MKVGIMKKHLDICPSCCGILEITQYTCPECSVKVEGHFNGCNFCKLSDDDRLFALIFLQTEGNMKDVERLLGISYPTVKARLAKLNASLSGTNPIPAPSAETSALQPAASPERQNSGTLSRILDRLQSGEITAQEASAFIRGRASDTSENNVGGNSNE
jgi:hypothetical protein